MKTFRRQIRPPSIVSGYRIDDLHRLSVIVPESGTNLWINPSCETNTTGYTAVGGASIARSTTQQRYGAYSLAITMSSATGDGTYFGSTALTSGTAYTSSIDVYAPAGMPLKLYFASTAAAQVGGVKQFKGTGRWQRIFVTYTETSSTSRRVYITKDASAMTGTVYVDGAQIEANTYPTTYIDGDQRGLVPNQSPPAYYWQGTPHASTSVRNGNTRAGGRAFPLSRYGFALLAMNGLGLATPEISVTEYAQLDGGEYQSTRKPSRTFQIAGRFDARTPIELDRLWGGLARVLDRDAIGEDQRLILQYQKYECDRAISDIVSIPCAYAGGLDGAMTSHMSEAATIALTTYQPALRLAGDSGTALTVQATVASNNRIIQRSPTGVWGNLSTGLNGLVDAIVTGKDGRIYVGGTFTTAGGSGANRVAYWDPVAQTWNAMSTGLDAQVRALAVAPNGDIIAGGSFTGKVSRWNGSAWSTVGTVPGTTPIIYDVVVDQTGNIYAVGTDTGTSRPLAAVWNGSAWTSLTAAGSATAIITCAVISRDNQLYVGGDFLTLDGTTLNRVARYGGTPNSWVALSTGMNSSVTDIEIGPDNRLYAVGLFTTAGGNAALYAAVWNGASWTNLGNGESGTASSIVINQQTSEIIVGSATGAWQFTGAAFVGLDLSISATNVYMTFGNDLTLYLGHDASGSLTTGATTTVTNNGTAYAYPTARITGPSSGTADIQRIVNYTTNRAIFLDLTMNAGEAATLILTPDHLSFLSDFQSNIASRILAGSNQADFFLAKGANAIGFYATSSTVTAVLYWTPTYTSLRDVTYT